MAAQLLVKEGHQVVIHARNATRAKAAISAVPGAERCLVADLSSIQETKRLARECNELGSFDAVIHNAGLGFQEATPGWTKEGLPRVFAVNSLAPYILTCLMHRPGRLVYITSGLQNSGDERVMDVEGMTWKRGRAWDGFQAYSDTKLHNVVLANAVARKWKASGVLSNSVSPGWVATKMGGRGAPDNLDEAPRTQVWLAVSDDAEATVSGKHFYHMKLKASHRAANDVEVQEKYLQACEKISGVGFPD